MSDKTPIIAALEHALEEIERSRDMIVTAELQRNDPNFIFGILVSARDSAIAAKTEIEKALEILKS